MRPVAGRSAETEDSEIGDGEGLDRTYGADGARGERC
jgi:hypothetical protein